VLALLALFVMTAIFDNVIIMLDIVAYEPSHILGLYVGRAPIEDFFYCIGAVLLLPYLWRRFDD
jgi:lycopene cyclase domain-containing protein